MAVQNVANVHTRVRFPSPAPSLDMSDKVGCRCLSDFIRVQMDVIGKHLDEHKYLRSMTDKDAALQSFISDYGWLMRELYCTRICEKRAECETAIQLSSIGDLLKDHLKKV